LLSRRTDCEELAVGIEHYRYDGKRAVVVGGATGMGAAVADIMLDLGASVTVLDYAEASDPRYRTIRMDLRAQASIDAAIEQCGGPIEALFCCAGVGDGAPDIEKVNFIGQRHLVDRALDAGYLPDGAAIGMISSIAAIGWERELDTLGQFLDTKTFDDAVRWIEAHPDRATYKWSKQAMSAYVAREAYPLRRRGIRINAILPGPTDTPLLRSNGDAWLVFGREYREALDIDVATPAEQAHPLIFLCSAAAAQVNGQNLVIDSGYLSAGLTGTFDSPDVRRRFGLT
jgi:NAD(P)-dependent dehydrogenase (short-subunit alcohol dehydrogenase family)